MVRLFDYPKLGLNSVALVIGSMSDLMKDSVEDLLVEGFQVLIITDNPIGIDDIKKRLNTDLISYIIRDADTVFNYHVTHKYMEELKSTCEGHRTIDLILNFIECDNSTKWYYYAYLKEIMSKVLQVLPLHSDTAMFNIYEELESSKVRLVDPYILTKLFRNLFSHSPLYLTSLSYETSLVYPRFINESIKTLLSNEELDVGYTLVDNYLFTRVDSGLGNLVSILA